MAWKCFAMKKQNKISFLIFCLYSGGHSFNPIFFLPSSCSSSYFLALVFYLLVHNYMKKFLILFFLSTFCKEGKVESHVHLHRRWGIYWWCEFCRLKLQLGGHQHLNNVVGRYVFAHVCFFFSFHFFFLALFSFRLLLMQFNCKSRN